MDNKFERVEENSISIYIPNTESSEEAEETHVAAVLQEMGKLEESPKTQTNKKVAPKTQTNKKVVPKTQTNKKVAPKTQSTNKKTSQSTSTKNQKSLLQKIPKTAKRVQPKKTNVEKKILL
jgi:hypothetical protein